MPALALASLGESVAEATAERRDYLPRGPARRPGVAEGLGPAKDSSPAAQYAEIGDHLFLLTGGNRFLFHGTLAECMDVTPCKTAAPLAIDWAAA